MALVLNFQLLFLLLISCHYATANCDDPTFPINGFIETNQNTAEGAEIFFKCNTGFVPTGRIKAVCGANGRWNPNPTTIVCTSWPIVLFIFGVLVWLVSIVILLTGMVSICGFNWCFWTAVIALLFTSVIGIPIAVALIVHNSKNKARKNEQCSTNASCSPRATCSRWARCYYGLYHGLSTVAYTFILNGLAWYIVFAVIAFRPLSDDSRSSIARDVLIAFCFSIAALVFAIVGAIFIFPYRKCKSERRDDSTQMIMSRYGATGNNPEDVKIKEAEDY